MLLRNIIPIIITATLTVSCGYGLWRDAIYLAKNSPQWLARSEFTVLRREERSVASGRSTHRQTFTLAEAKGSGERLLLIGEIIGDGWMLPSPQTSPDPVYPNMRSMDWYRWHPYVFHAANFTIGGTMMLVSVLFCMALVREDVGARVPKSEFPRLRDRVP